MGRRLERTFYRRDVLEVAPDLLGKILVIAKADGSTTSYTISETEAYRGGEDRACHASRGRTRRTEVMFRDGGHVYMYLIYGMYWMLNIVTAGIDAPQAVLVRGLREASGPGRLTRLTGLNGSFYGEDLVQSRRIWMEESGARPDFRTGPRVGVDYAGQPWKDMPWRYILVL
jgi:DNA-3-methyladenine glycosylase